MSPKNSSPGPFPHTKCPQLLTCEIYNFKGRIFMTTFNTEKRKLPPETIFLGANRILPVGVKYIKMHVLIVNP